MALIFESSAMLRSKSSKATQCCTSGCSRSQRVISRDRRSAHRNRRVPSRSGLAGLPTRSSSRACNSAVCPRMGGNPKARIAVATSSLSSGLRRHSEESTTPQPVRCTRKRRARTASGTNARPPTWTGRSSPSTLIVGNPSSLRSTPSMSRKATKRGFSGAGASEKMSCSFARVTALRSFSGSGAGIPEYKESSPPVRGFLPADSSSPSRSTMGGLGVAATGGGLGLFSTGTACLTSSRSCLRCRHSRTMASASPSRPFTENMRSPTRMGSWSA
mmetsp:Transcript_104435/g.322206  ORF Transcript_104435/g.322206 Transcript_104435/m.322206 type:complete len:274 (+) Transcript_104435:177-998(+)